MENTKRIFGVGMFLLVVLSLVSSVSAFGIAVSYWEPDNLLRIEPGDSADISFRLQNTADEDDQGNDEHARQQSQDGPPLLPQAGRRLTLRAIPAGPPYSGYARRRWFVYATGP